MTLEQKNDLLREVAKLHERHDLASKVGPDYFEPGMMEYLDQSEGLYDEATGELMLRFEARGTRYEDRSEHIESVSAGDTVIVRREADNQYNRNNFTLLTEREKNVGNMPAELCNVLAPLFDEGSLVFLNARVSFVEPISKRSRNARQAVLFVELNARLK